MKNFGQRSWDIRIYGRAPTAKLLLNRVILKSLRKSDRDLVTFNDVSMCALNRCEAVCQPGDDTHAIDAGDGRVEGPPSNLRAVQRIGIGWAASQAPAIRPESPTRMKVGPPIRKRIVQLGTEPPPTAAPVSPTRVP